MCMKNVNMNCFVCRNLIGESDIPSFIGVTDTLSGSICGTGIKIDNFNIVVFANIIQAKNEEELFVNYECSMRITSFAGKTTEIARFRLNDNMDFVSKEEGVVCRNFASNQFFIPLKEYVFPDGEGRYILKVLIRRRDDIGDAKPENDTQFMMQLYIKRNDTSNCVE